jgi:hypothetical protein
MMQNVCIELPDGGGGANCAKLHGGASGLTASAHH